MPQAVIGGRESWPESFLHRRELVAFGAHAEVREARLFHVAVGEGIVERAERPAGERAAQRIAVHPRRECGVIAHVVPARLAPRFLLALLAVRGELRGRRVGLDPLHRRAGRGEHEQYRDAKSLHIPWTAKIAKLSRKRHAASTVSPWDRILDIYPWICSKHHSRSSISRRQGRARPPTG